MPGILSAAFHRHLLSLQLARTMSLVLFTNDFMPVPGMAPEDLTEATFDGYAPEPLVQGNWTQNAAGLVPQTATHVQVQFQSASQQPQQRVYGYAILDTLANLVVGAERFPDGPYLVANANDTIRVTPVLTQGPR